MGESLISGIGQGYILTTPLQLVTMMARLVNGGYEVRPTFIKVSEQERSQIKKINVSRENLELLKEGMFNVVNKPGGTAYWSQFNYNGQRMGGKTGTTQVRRITMKERQTGILKEEELPWRRVIMPCSWVMLRQIIRNMPLWLLLSTAAADLQWRRRWLQKFLRRRLCLIRPKKPLIPDNESMRYVQSL